MKMLIVRLIRNTAFLSKVFLVTNLSFNYSKEPPDSLLPGKPYTHDLVIPNTLSTHPLGLYISRLNHNFQMRPSRGKVFVFNLSSGNVWLPQVKAYIPRNESDREPLRDILWFNRGGTYNYNAPSDSIELHADGIYRSYRFGFTLPIKLRNELKFELRAVSIDPGNQPYTMLISDRFIEWFHSNIKGGEDPFARKEYGFEQLHVSYTDENGKSFEIKENQISISGLELSYSYYPNFPNWNAKGFFSNFTVNLGGNLTKQNPTFDLGINTTSLQRFSFSGNEIFLGISLNALRQSIIRYGKGVRLSDNKVLYSVDFLSLYRRNLRNSSSISIGINCFIQRAYRKKSVADYYVLDGEPYSSHWHYAISHLYRPTLSNSLIIGYQNNRYALNFYLKEDFVVDNAPDGQSGIEFRYFLPNY